MQVYLPIAEMAVSPWLMIGLGLIVGCLSGIFGVGGGFLMTPLLMLIGIPAPIAVVSGANLAAASSMSSILGQLENRGRDWLGIVCMAQVFRRGRGNSSHRLRGAARQPRVQLGLGECPGHATCTGCHRRGQS
jgi:hypothetical protein